MPYQLSRPLVAPLGIPPDRAKALQEAFRKASTDPDDRAEAAKLELDESPIESNDVLQLIGGLEKSPPEVRAEMKAWQAAP